MDQEKLISIFVVRGKLRGGRRSHGIRIDRGAGREGATAGVIRWMRRRRGRVNGDDIHLIKTIGTIGERGRRIARSRGVVLNGQADRKIGDINSLRTTAPGIDRVELQLRHRIADLDVQGPAIFCCWLKIG